MLKGAALILDRYDLVKSMQRWRVSFFLLLAVFLLFLLDPNLADKKSVNHVARIKINGFIDINNDEIDAIKKLAKNDRVRAVIIDIDSGGGTVVGGEYYYYAVKEVAAKKPVVAYFGNQATSAAYMIAMASNHIVSPEGAITGSVGVIAQSAEFSGLAEKLGIKPIIIKSSPLKAAPHPAEKLNPDAVREMEEVVGDIYGFFLGILLENRQGLTKEQIAEISSGKIFTGRQALDIGLVDDIGDFSKVEKWLKAQLKVEKLNIVRRNLVEKDSLNLFDYVQNILFEKQKAAFISPSIVSYWPQMQTK